MTNQPENGPALRKLLSILASARIPFAIWIKKGVIPHRRIGKQYKFKISEVDAWVNSGKSAKIE